MAKQRMKLVQIRVRKQTYDHLCAMADMHGMKHPGEVVDKIVRNIRITLREGRYRAGNPSAKKREKPETRGGELL